MFDISLFFLIQNILVLTVIFWTLSFLGEKFYKNKAHKHSTEIFECGFVTLDTLELSINFNFFLIAGLLLIYDIEFMLLLPFLFNFTNVIVFEIILMVAFLVLIFSSFIFDWEIIAITWTI